MLLIESGILCLLWGTNGLVFDAEKGESMANTNGKLDKFIMKRLNQRLVFSIILRGGSVSRQQIAAQSRMSQMSVGRIIEELEKLGIVAEENGGEPEAGPGRRAKRLRISSSAFLCVGVEMHRDGVNVGIINLHGRVLRQIQHQKDLSACPPGDAIALIGTLVGRILAENADLPVEPFVGIACPGLIDDGVIRFSSQLKWKNVEILPALQKQTGIRNIFIENEVKARAVAEDLFGAGRDYERSIVLSIGSGVGSAAVFRHELYRGKLNMAGEIGHICVSPGGNMCECGRRGCLQTYIADWAILREARTVREDITMQGLLEANANGELWVINLMNRVLEYVSIAISILANTYAPDVIILCGRLTEEYGMLRDLILKNYKREISDYVLSSFDLKASDFDSDGTLVGAGTLAAYRLLDEIL
ncbi:MAG: ROK family transcriptional regulator [Faecalispora sporosphaeroides]|uniref:ROK family transcriptional regulator n=1 Tax=Faecalispora sporosphaeroides TaxID=1549 RepID=UPI0039950537